MAWRCIIEPPGLSIPIVQALCDTLTTINVEWLRRNPATPPIYGSGVRYRREPPGHETWRCAARTLELGHGDCEDLGCWLAAELQVAGEPARAFPVRKWRPRGWLYHILVRRGDGSIEDPSRKLGMGRL